MQYLINRMSERSTWRGLIFVLSALGVSIRPEIQDAIIVFGLALAGMVDAFMPEARGDTDKPHVQDKEDGDAEDKGESDKAHGAHGLWLR